MLMNATAYHQLGKFIVWFQHAEAEINEIIVLLSETDKETVHILINDLEYSKRINTADVLFSRFVDLRTGIDSNLKSEFHRLISDLNKLGNRRNDLVHSRYFDWVTTDGNKGLIRKNSMNRASKGINEKQEEELLPETFYADFKKLQKALESLNGFRLKIIDWLYPNE
jgi:hypothetical protein